MSPSRPTAGNEEGREKICWKCGRSFHTEIELCPDDGSRLLELTSEDRKDPLIGTLFDGRYRIFHKLGEGGMGAVYSARSLDSTENVALKLLKSDFARDEGIRKRFFYEAHTISNLEHAHSVRFYDFGQTTDGQFYMVMELLRGESLAERLAHRFVSYAEIFAIVPPICGVLGEAHTREVIHRDLKPENIFLQKIAEGHELPKLLDFGIAKHHGIATMTQSGALWGTPAYMSPEQARGDVIGPRADIYGIGVMLYELISGNLPFHATTQMGFAVKHINEPARSLLTIPGLHSVPVELDHFVLSLLAKDPEQRPETMEEVATTLLSIREAVFNEALLARVPALEVDPVGLKAWVKSTTSSPHLPAVESASDSPADLRSDTMVPTLSIFPDPANHAAAEQVTAEQVTAEQVTLKVTPSLDSNEGVHSDSVELSSETPAKRVIPRVWIGLVSLVGVAIIVLGWAIWSTRLQIDGDDKTLTENRDVAGVINVDEAGVERAAGERAEQVVLGSQDVIRDIMAQQSEGGFAASDGTNLIIVDEPLEHSEEFTENSWEPEQKKSVKPKAKTRQRTLKEALEKTF